MVSHVRTHHADFSLVNPKGKQGRDVPPLFKDLFRKAVIITGAPRELADPEPLGGLCGWQNMGFFLQQQNQSKINK